MRRPIAALLTLLAAALPARADETWTNAVLATAPATSTAVGDVIPLIHNGATFQITPANFLIGLSFTNPSFIGTATGNAVFPNSLLVNPQVSLSGHVITLGSNYQLLTTDISGLGTMATQNAGTVAITGGTITGMPTPSATSDVATKSYVDSTSAGLTVHTSARVATAVALPANTYSNGTLGVGATLTGNSNGALTVDGVAVATSDRVLVKNEVAGANNGVYSVTAAGSGGAAYVLTRVTDFNQASNIAANSYFFVTAGTANTATGWLMTTAGAITVGTTALAFTQFSASTAYTAGAGLTLTGSAFTVSTQAANSILGNATSGSAIPTALPVGSCSTSASALNYTINTGFSCNNGINAATLGGATFAAPGAIGGGTPGAGFFAALNASGDALFKSGRPWVDVQAFGAVGDSVTDDSAAIQAAVNALPGNGGIAIVTAGHGGVYCVKSTVNIPSTTWLLGVGVNSSVLSACGTNTTLLNMTGSYARISNMQLLGLGSAATDAINTNVPTLKIGSGCVDCRLDHVVILGGLNAISIVNTGDVILEDIFASASYGAAVIYIQGSQAWLRRAKIDQSWPAQGVCCANQTLPAWQASHAYSLGDVVNTQGYYIQASQAGTSASSQPTLKAYTATITDNTVRWKLVGAMTYYGVQVDTGSSQVIGEQVDLNGTFSAGFAMTNTLAGAAPFLSSLSHSSFGSLVGDGIKVSAGYGLAVDDITVAGCALTSCAGINFASGWQSGSTIVNSKLYNGGYGILDNAGVNLTATGNLIAGQAVAGFFANSGISQFVVMGNIIGSDGNFGGANLVGAAVNTGASDFYNISNNICHGATACVNDSGSGTHKNVDRNQ